MYYHQLGQISAAVEIIKAVAKDPAVDRACAIIDREVAAIVDLNVQEGLEQAAEPQPAVGHGPQTAGSDAPTPQAARVLERVRRSGKKAPRAKQSAIENITVEQFISALHDRGVTTVTEAVTYAKERGITMTKLAQWCDITPDYMRRISRDEAVPPYIAQAVAGVFYVNIDSIAISGKEA